MELGHRHTLGIDGRRIERDAIVRIREIIADNVDTDAVPKMPIEPAMVLVSQGARASERQPIACSPAAPLLHLAPGHKSPAFSINETLM